MEASKPICTAGGFLPHSFAEVLATSLLGTGFVEARGNPGVGAPAMIESFELVKVPAPLDDSFAGREHADETEGIHAGEGQRGEGRIDISGSGGSEGELHDFTATDRLASDARGDGIPVDQREGRAGVVHSNPSATVRFRRKKNIAAAEAMSRRRQCGHARQLFVAVHAEGVAVSPCDKGDG